MSESNLIELIECRESVSIVGATDGIISTYGDITFFTILNQNLSGDIKKENVKAFYIDENKNPPELYLHFKNSELLLGQIGDVQIAKKLVEKINSKYKTNH